MAVLLKQQFAQQRFPNDYQLVNGVAMHRENGDRFQIPPNVIKRHVRPGQFVELRLDSPRFATHDDAPEKCTCPSCNGAMTKPILSHEHPLSLLPLPKQNVPSRGWGEDFWVRVLKRDDAYFAGIIDNYLAETRLHGLEFGKEVVFHEDHILAVHSIHRMEIVFGLAANELKELAHWLG